MRLPNAKLALKCMRPRIPPRLPPHSRHSFAPTRLASSRAPSQHLNAQDELFNFTSGRWVHNEALRQAERRRIFDVEGLRRLAAESVGRDSSDVVSLSKLGEGGFNRTFLVTMRDGFEMVARIPYGFPPLYLTVASEVATMDLLHSSGVPVPKVYGYSPGSDNAAKTEYIFMEYMRGTSLADVWLEIEHKPEEARPFLEQLAEVEAKVTKLAFPAGGSIYYPRDLEGLVKRKPISLEDSRFCVGPDVNPTYWYGRRSQLDVDRGPFSSGEDMLVAPARKELAYLKQFGRPLLPFRRERRKGYGYREQSPSDHVVNLNRFLQIVPSLVRGGEFGRFSIRHPDLRDGNVIVERSNGGSGSWRIVSVIDWERTSILPEFLQDSVEQYLYIDEPDPDNDDLELPDSWHPSTVPSLPENFKKMDEGERAKAEEVYRRRFINHLYLESGCPWVGETLDLKYALMKAAENWERLTKTATASGPGTEASGATPTPACPVTFADQDVAETMALMKVRSEMDRRLWVFECLSHVRSEGKVYAEHYEAAMEACREKLAEDLERAETEEERENVRKHWMFDDMDEEEYD